MYSSVSMHITICPCHRHVTEIESGQQHLVTVFEDVSPLIQEGFTSSYVYRDSSWLVDTHLRILITSIVWLDYSFLYLAHVWTGDVGSLFHGALNYSDRAWSFPASRLLIVNRHIAN